MSVAALRRVGLVGDVHCEHETLDRVLNALQALEIERILCVGDIVDGYGSADQALDILRERNITCVAGNHERWLLSGHRRTVENATGEVTHANAKWLSTLPVVLPLNTVRGPAILCHGVGEDDEAWLMSDTRGFGLQQISTLGELMRDENVLFMLSGHTHEVMVREFPGLTVINAGTIHRDFDQRFLVADFERSQVHVYDAGPSRFGKLVETVPLPTPRPLSLNELIE